MAHIVQVAYDAIVSAHKTYEEIHVMNDEVEEDGVEDVGDKPGIWVKP